jgi:class 3 adenylate cyclase
LVNRVKRRMPIRMVRVLPLDVGRGDGGAVAAFDFLVGLRWTTRNRPGRGSASEPGVHTARTWFGAVGRGSCVELTAVGDAVNTTARLASLLPAARS